MVMQYQLRYPQFTRCSAGSIGASLICESGSAVNTDLMCIGYRNTLNPIASGSFRPGIFRINPVIIEKAVGVSFPASYEFHWAGTTLDAYKYNGDYAAAQSRETYRASPSWATAEATNCALKAKAKLLDADADVALMLAELTETLNMLRNPFKGLIKFLRSVRKGKPSSVPTFTADSWLLYRYGISPFISDIESLIQLFNKRMKQYSGLITKRSGLKWTTSSHPVPDATIQYDRLYCRRTVLNTVSHAMMAHVYAQAMFAVPMAFEPGRLGFDPRQAPALLWEIVPYSFVIDWVLNVGDWLRAIMPPLNSTYLGTCVSYKTTFSSRIEVSNPQPERSWYTIKRADMGSYTWSGERLQRIVLSTPPALPAFTVRRLDFVKALDALSLLWGQLPRR